MAFDQVGVSSLVAFRESGTKRALDGVAAVAMAGVHHQSQQLRVLTDAVGQSRVGGADWLLVQRGLDATPVTVAFGTLANMVAPWARYWHRPSLKKTSGEKQKQVQGSSRIPRPISVQAPQASLWFGDPGTLRASVQGPPGCHVSGAFVRNV